MAAYELPFSRVAATNKDSSFLFNLVDPKSGKLAQSLTQGQTVPICKRQAVHDQQDGASKRQKVLTVTGENVLKDKGSATTCYASLNWSSVSEDLMVNVNNSGKPAAATEKSNRNLGTASSDSKTGVGAKRYKSLQAKHEQRLPLEQDDSGSVDTVLHANCPGVEVPAVEDQASLSAGSQSQQLTLQFVPFDLLTSHCVTVVKENPHLDLTCGHDRSMRSVMDHLLCKWKRAMEIFSCSGGLTIIPAPESNCKLGPLNSTQHALHLQNVKVHHLHDGTGANTLPVWYTFLPGSSEGGWLRPILTGKRIVFPQNSETAFDSSISEDCTTTPTATSYGDNPAVPMYANCTPDAGQDLQLPAGDDNDEFMATLLGVPNLAVAPTVFNVPEPFPHQTLPPVTANAQGSNLCNVGNDVQTAVECDTVDLLEEAFEEVGFSLLDEYELGYGNITVAKVQSDSISEPFMQVCHQMNAQNQQGSVSTRPPPAADCHYQEKCVAVDQLCCQSDDQSKLVFKATTELPEATPCLTPETLQASEQACRLPNIHTALLQNTELPVDHRADNLPRVLGDITNTATASDLPSSPVCGLLVVEGCMVARTKNNPRLKTEFSGFPIDNTEADGKSDENASWREFFHDAFQCSPCKKPFDILDLIE